MSARCTKTMAIVLAVVLLVGAFPICSISALETQAVTLPFSAEEFLVLLYTNRQRLAAGLNPLTCTADLQTIGDIRAKEIGESFSHTRPDGSDCFSVIDSFDVSWNTIGENIAYGYPTPAAVVEGWMNSPGHRANILTENFTHIGIGASNSRWVQFFVGCYGSENYTFTAIHTLADISFGMEIDEMFMYAELENAVYGTCYLPIGGEFVSGYDPNKTGSQTVTVSFLGFTESLELNIPGNPAGDVDGDRQVTAEDARLALRAAVGLTILTAQQKQAADTDGDNKVTSADARLILRIAVGLDTIS